MQFWVDIYPGQVTYFTFTDEDGFQSRPTTCAHAGFPAPSPTPRHKPTNLSPGT